MTDQEYINEIMRIAEKVFKPVEVVNKRTGKTIITKKQMRRKAIVELKQELLQYKAKRETAQ